MMTEFATRRLAAEPEAIAPDGTGARTLLRLGGGSFTHFELAPGQTSAAVTHRTVEEIWYVLSGRGEIWRKQAGREEVVELAAGVCVSIPRGTSFQFRALAGEALTFVAITMPPWPGSDEAAIVAGNWEPTVTAGTGR